MLFVLNQDITTKKGKKFTWIEAGTYPVVRFFDKSRVMLDVSLPEAPNRLLTVVNLNKGTLLHGGANVQETEDF